MMICFAGFLQNSCCNNTNKNKITTTKNTECKCGHLTQLRAFTDVKCRVSVLCRETRTTTNFFHFRYYNVKNHIFLRFFGSTSTFFLKVNGNISFGRALSRSPVTHGFFRRFFTTFWMRSWRNAWRYLFGSRMWTDDCRPAWKFFIKVIVTELCVIKSWWKIKFNKQKKFINLFFLL